MIQTLIISIISTSFATETSNTVRSSEKKLVGISNYQSTLDEVYTEQFFSSEFFSINADAVFTIKDLNNNSKPVFGWCQNTAITMLEKSGEVGANGDAQATVRALKAVCGEAYLLDLTISHSCSLTVETTDSGKSYRTATCPMSMDFTLDNLKENRQVEL